MTEIFNDFKGIKKNIDLSANTYLAEFENDDNSRVWKVIKDDGAQFEVYTLKGILHLWEKKAVILAKMLLSLKKRPLRLNQKQLKSLLVLLSSDRFIFKTQSDFPRHVV